MWVKSQYNKRVDEYALKYSVAIEHITRNKHHLTIQASNIQPPPPHRHTEEYEYTHTYTQ